MDESVRPFKWVGEDKKPDFWVVMREHKNSLAQKHIFVKFTADNRTASNRCLLEFMYEEPEEKFDPRKK